MRNSYSDNTIEYFDCCGGHMKVYKLCTTKYTQKDNSDLGDQWVI